MRVYLLFLLYILTLMALAAAVLPWTHPTLFATVGLTPESSLYRSAMLAALLCMPLFLRFLRLDSWAAAGFAAPRGMGWRSLGKGFAAGCLILGVLATVQWAAGIQHLAVSPEREGLPYLIRSLLSGAVSGLAVGLIEETFFRGLMHTGMRRSLGFWPTALLTGLLYGVVHFVKPVPPGGGPLTSAEAFGMLAGGLARLGEPAAFADSLVTLVVAGVFLSMVRERTGSIVWAIGIHAGWVMVIKVFKHLTDPTVVGGQTSPWIGSGYDSVTGWMATIWLGALAAVYWWAGRGPTPRVSGKT